LLTGDLVRARRKGSTLVPCFLDVATAARVLPLARALVSVHGSMLGSAREEVDQALASVGFGARDRVLGLGLVKLLADRSTYEVVEGVEPEALRRELFLRAARAHRALDVRDAFDREMVIAELGAERALEPAAIERGLYADLRSAEVLKSFEPITAEELLARYDVALAQAMLLRATKVTVRLEGEAPATYRRLFRAARFHGLLHVVTGSESEGYTLELDGPFSLFEAVQRYGLRLAIFLPHVLTCRSFALTADVVWGKSREALTFTLTARQGLAGPEGELPTLSPELTVFCRAFAELGSGWRVAVSERLFALPGRTVCVPDLVFRHAETGEEVYLEAFGFWSRDAVWRRIELVREGFPARLILAVGKQLRVSEEVLGEDDAGELYVYKTIMSPRAVLGRLNRRR
jgi:predicted nuclease of restriction endonuclease-like RecB superfamily